MSKKSTKKALLLSALAMFACVAMLIGSTFAWFTDSVTSAGNKIQAGTLQIDLELLDKESGEFKSIKNDKTPLFNYQLWEPGYTEAVVLKLENEGSLALRWVAKFESDYELTDLANVIDVYVLKSDSAISYPQNRDLEGYELVGTVAEFVNTIEETQSGSLLAKESVYMGIALKMQESAGNEYQGMPLCEGGNGFDITIYATQYTYEEDSFDKYYDSLANPWNGQADTSWYDAAATEYVIDTPEKLAGFASIVNGTADGIAIDSFKNKTVKLAADIDLGNKAWTPIGDVDADDFVGFQGTFDGQGHTIYNLSINSTSWGQGLFGYFMSKGAVVKNFTVRNASVKAADTSAVVAGYATYGTFENVHVTGTIAIEGNEHMGGIVGNGYYANFNNCSVIADGSIVTTGGSFVGGIVGYHGQGNLSITNCVVKNVAISGFAAVGGITGLASASNTIDGCVVENVVLTKTREGGDPAIGAIAGCYTYNASLPNTITNCTASNVTLKGDYENIDPNVLCGSEYSGQTGTNFVTDGSNTDGVDNQLVKLVQEIVVTSAAELTNALANAAPGSVIDATGVTADVNTIGTDAANGKKQYTVPGDVTIKNMTFTGTYRGGSYIFFGGTSDQKIVFENCTFELARGMGFGFLGQDGAANSVEFNNCTFKGAIILEFPGNPNGVATYNNCTFTRSASGNSYVMANSGTHIFNGCTFDYTGATQSNMGIANTCCINVMSESDGSSETTVILDGCTRINCGTHKYGAKSTLTIK